MIKIRTHITLPREEIWEYWTKPEHITHWNFASPDWHCPEAKNDLRDGGVFSYRMAAKDGSMAFDFAGKHSKIETPMRISSVIDDGREMSIHFHPVLDGTEITQRFEPESINDPDLQEKGWQAILDNFKRYAESQ